MLSNKRLIDTHISGPVQRRQVWHCMLAMLTDPRYQHIVQWRNSNGTFEVMDRYAAAEVWEQYAPRARKADPNDHRSEEKRRKAAWENVTRSIRYYAEKNKINPILIKPPGRFFLYKFTKPIVELTGYTVDELIKFNAEYKIEFEEPTSENEMKTEMVQKSLCPPRNLAKCAKIIDCKIVLHKCDERLAE